MKTHKNKKLKFWIPFTSLLALTGVVLLTLVSCGADPNANKVVSTKILYVDSLKEYLNTYDGSKDEGLMRDDIFKSVIMGVEH